MAQTKRLLTVTCNLDRCLSGGRLFGSRDAIILLNKTGEKGNFDGKNVDRSLLTGRFPIGEFMSAEFPV